MTDFQHPIDVLAEDIRLRTNQADEWETTSDPHAVNKPRAELLRHQIAQDEAAIEVLKQEATKQRNSPPSPSLRRGEFAGANSEG
jgi:hypothetical protein